jgi:hypothetical protein
LAFVAANLGQWRRAAQLHGVADAFRDQTGQPWVSWYRPHQQESFEKVRAQLDNDEFEQSYTRARVLSFDEAVRLALLGPESK